MSGGGGGGGGGGTPDSVVLPAAGPARSLARYQQYNPFTYAGMQPGTQQPMPGAGPAIASYMPAINQMMGMGGPQGTDLIRALMAGYAGIPAAQQPTGAQAPGMGTMAAQQVNPVPSGGPVDGNRPDWRDNPGRGGASGSGSEEDEERRRRREELDQSSYMG